MTDEEPLTLRIRPRSAFRPYLERSQRWATLVAHRRAGKTVAVIQDLIARACTNPRQKPPPRYAYIAPTRDQAKDIAWRYLEEYTEQIPGVQINQAELRILLPNGAQIRLYSGDNYERMRGLYFDGVVVDEDADMNPNAYPYVIRPCLMDYHGWCTRIGTPKGKNSFYRSYKQAQRDEDSFALMLKASESGILDPEELALIRRDVFAEVYAQEMECDFNVGRPGAIYAKAIADSREAEPPRIFEFDVDPVAPVNTTWDLGAPQNTVVIYWQKVGFGHRVVDVDHFGNMPSPSPTTAERVAHMKEKGYSFGVHCLPHDAKKVEYDGLEFATKLREAGLANVVSIPRETHRAEDKRIIAVRDLLPNVYFRESTCDGEGGLIDAMENYHRKESVKDGTITNDIVHDWSSHFADAFGYYCEALKHRLIRDPFDLRDRPETAETPARMEGRTMEEKSKRLRSDRTSARPTTAIM